MKKTLLALAVAGIAAASAASAAKVYDDEKGTTLDVYGRVQAVAYSQDSNNTAASGDAGIVGSGRLGIDARTDLGYGIAGIAKAEWDAADADANPAFSDRYMWVGADFGAFGKLYAGRTDNAIKYVNNTTDIFEDFGQFATEGSDTKRSGQINYEWSGWGFDVNLAYQSSKDASGSGIGAGASYFDPNKNVLDVLNDIFADKNLIVGGLALDTTANVKNGFSASAGYTSPDVLFGPIAVKAGYEYVRYQDDKASATDSDLDNHKGWAAALSWGTDGGVGPYVGVLYNERQYNYDDIDATKTVIQGGAGTALKNDELGLVGYDNRSGSFDLSDMDVKVKGVEAVVAYGFDCGVQIKTGYEWRKVEFEGLNYTINAKLDPNKKPVNVTLNSSLDGSYKQAVVPVYINYNVNENFNVWTEARFDAGSDDEVETENQYSVGARYTF